jgi:hypothetical protein
MKKFRLELRRACWEYVTVTIEAEDKSAAITKAMHDAGEGNLDFTDDFSDTPDDAELVEACEIELPFSSQVQRYRDGRPSEQLDYFKTAEGADTFAWEHGGAVVLVPTGGGDMWRVTRIITD